MFQIKAKLLYNKRVRGSYFHCAMRAPKIALNASAGQFVNIKVRDNIDPLLRRPFSIHRVCGSCVEILYEVLGLGTKILSQTKSNEYLDIIGPLGNGFIYEPEAKSNGTKILVAGGMGVAPLIFLAEKLAECKIQNPMIPLPSPLALSGDEVPKSKIVVLIGAKTESQILCEREFKALGCEVKVATDNGSRGFKGYASDLLNKTIAAIDCRQSAIYACGPKPMLEAVNRVSQKHKIFAQVSWEEHMACGIGACLGCVVKTKGGYKRVCKEGPVFNAEEIIW